ncbi:MAG: PIN domain-containing protein [Thermodesulfobacteriota bacterium]
MALFERDNAPGTNVIFVTMDTNLRIRADALGLKAENYEGGRIREESLPTSPKSINPMRPSARKRMLPG